MAYVNQTTRSLGLSRMAGDAVQAIVAFVAGLADSWHRAQVYRNTYAALDALSTRELDDLGLSRSMISRVAFEAAYAAKD